MKSKEIFSLYENYIHKNKDIDYSVKQIPVYDAHFRKWIGGQIFEEELYGIPVDSNSILKYSLKSKGLRRLGELSNKKYKWTGSTVYKDKLYCFPRSENTVLVIDLKNDGIMEKPLLFCYEGEHHYGGVCTEKGIVYQPPRDSDHILCINLNNFFCEKIPLPRISRYCGSIIHPNGFAYFFPERNERVIKLNIDTKQVEFLGEAISTMCFDAVTAVDGNIYGFSSYTGIMKIDVIQETCSMIKEDMGIGSYGTKPGVNGKLYSIPGRGRYVWEYDIFQDLLRVIYDVKDERTAKFAGGVVTGQGEIYAVSANADILLYYEPVERAEAVPEEVYNIFFKDCY